MATLTLLPAASVPVPDPSDSALYVAAGAWLKPWADTPMTHLSLVNLLELIGLSLGLDQVTAVARAREAERRFGVYLLSRRCGLTQDCDCQAVDRWASRRRADVLRSFLLAAARYADLAVAS